jgi:hypothetical protein
MITLNEAIKIWQESSIDYCEVAFSCGGDSMNDIDFNFYNNSTLVSSDELDKVRDYLDDEMYRAVEFYVNSDGHYIGESGTVTIKLISLLGKEDTFNYEKQSTSEFEEYETIKVEVELTNDQRDFIDKYVSSIYGTYDDQPHTLTYKSDFILTDKLDEVSKSIEELCCKVADETMPKQSGEVMEYFDYSSSEDSTNVEDDSIELNGNILTLYIGRRVVVFLSNN